MNFNHKKTTVVFRPEGGTTYSVSGHPPKRGSIRLQIYTHYTVFIKICQ